MIQILLPVDGIEADIEIIRTKGADGKERPSAINIKPKFYSATATVPVAHVQVDGPKGPIQRAVFKQSAKTGRVVLADQTEPVVPAFQKKEVKPNVQQQQ